MKMFNKVSNKLIARLLGTRFYISSVRGFEDQIVGLTRES